MSVSDQQENFREVPRRYFQPLLMQYRFLYLIGQLGTGGSERQLFYLVQAMDRGRYRPAVVGWSQRHTEPYGSRIRDLGIPLHSLPKSLSPSAKLKEFRRLVLQWNPEMVHSYSFYTNFAVWWATLGSRTLPIGSIRNDFWRERRASGKILGRLSARWPEAQVCNSQTAKRIVERSSSPFKPSRLYLVRNRLDLDVFKPHPVLPEKPKLFAVGSLTPRKRWDRMLKIVATVNEKKLRFSVRHAGEGPLSGELLAQAKQLGLNNLLEFLGPRHDIAELLADSSFLLHTADDEGTPNVVMEAMACGRAVVATDAGDVPYLVDDGKTGFVVRRGDDVTFVERVVQLINDRDLCKRMGEAARAKAEKEFCLDGLVEDTLTAYRAAGWRDS